MEPIRVLHVFGWLESGGAESRTMDIYRHIDKEKIQFDFLIHTNKVGFFEEEIRSMGGNIYRVPKFNFINFFKYRKAIEEFIKRHPEYKINHGHMLSTAFIYMKIARLRQVPVRIVHSRSGSSAQKTIISFVKKLTNKLSRFNATHLFAVSKIAGYGAFNKKLVDSGKVNVIPNAIDSKKYSFNDEIRNQIRDDLNLKDSIVIGHIGRLTLQKNHIFLLDIFSEIAKKVSNSKLVLIGDGELRSQIKDKIKALDLEGKVIMLGIRDDVPLLLQAMDVLLFPSTHEGLPGVVLESQASGLPSVISSAITKEVKITDLVKYISLTQSKEYWAKEVLKTIDETKREDIHKSIVEAGYDIISIAKWYENFYLQNYNS